MSEGQGDDGSELWAWDVCFRGLGFGSSGCKLRIRGFKFRVAELGYLPMS